MFCKPKCGELNLYVYPSAGGYVLQVFGVLRTLRTRLCAPLCYGIALKCLKKTGDYLMFVNGNVFVLLRRHILDIYLKA